MFDPVKYVSRKYQWILALIVAVLYFALPILTELVNQKESEKTLKAPENNPSVDIGVVVGTGEAHVVADSFLGDKIVGDKVAGHKVTNTYTGNTIIGGNSAVTIYGPEGRVDAAEEESNLRRLQLQCLQRIAPMLESLDALAAHAALFSLNEQVEVQRDLWGRRALKLATVDITDCSDHVKVQLGYAEAKANDIYTVISENNSRFSQRDITSLQKKTEDFNGYLSSIDKHRFNNLLR